MSAEGILARNLVRECVDSDMFAEIYQIDAQLHAIWWLQS